MAEEEQQGSEESAAVELPDDVKQQLEELERLKAHQNKLLDETKTAKQRAKELEEAQQKLDEDRQKEKGEFKTLYEKAVADLEEERKQSRTFQQQVRAKEIDSEAYKLVSKLTKDASRAEFLKKHVLEFAEHTDEGVKFVIGGVEMPQDKLIEKIRADYPFLVDGSGATGGGATGASRGGASTVGKVDGTKAERAAYYASKFNLN